MPTEQFQRWYVRPRVEHDADIVIQAEAELEANPYTLIATVNGGLPNAADIAESIALRGHGGSRLLYSQRDAIDRAGAPTQGPGGIPVSDGWRAAWVAEELIRTREERDQLHALQAEQQRAFAEGLALAQRKEREEGARLMRDHVANIFRERAEWLRREILAGGTCDVERDQAAYAADRVSALDPATVVGSGS